MEVKPKPEVISNQFVKQLSEININLRKFGIINSNSARWLITGLEEFLGTDELFFPLITIGVKVTPKGQQTAWRVVMSGKQSSLMSISKNLSNAALELAIRYGRQEKEKIKPKSKIVKPHGDIVAQEGKLRRGELKKP